MKTGTEQIKRLIMSKLGDHNAVLRGIGYGKFAGELANEIFELIGGDMDASWNTGHGFPQELEGIVRILEKGLGIILSRKPETIETYQWIKEQNEKGRSVKRFIEWATGAEQAKFVGKYRFNPGLIKLDYQYAFENKAGYNPQNLEVGI